MTPLIQNDLNQPPLFLTLPIGAQLTVWGLRHLYPVASGHRTASLPCVWQSFSQAGLDQGYLNLCELAVCLSEQRATIKTWPPVCQRFIDQREQAILQVLDALYDGNVMNAKAYCNSLVDEGFQGQFLLSAADLCRDFARRGLHFEHATTSIEPSLRSSANPDPIAMH
ncbi:MAG: hypothetical protein AAF465_02750 [Pseudomonadota bacterium]